MSRSLRADRPNNVGTREPVPAKTTGLGPGEPVPFFQVRADDDDAQNLNVVVAPVVESRDPAKHGPCVALLEWGTGSATAKAEIDIAKGTQIQISASYVALAVRNDGNVDDGTGSPVDPAPGVQEVAAMVGGSGGRVAFGKATRTFYFRRIRPASSVEVTVPNFAKSVLITRHALATTAIAIELLDNLPVPAAPGGDPEFPPGPNLRASYAFGAGVAASSIDLFAATAFVRVRNSGEGDIAFLQVAFELAL